MDTLPPGLGEAWVVEQLKTATNGRITLNYHGQSTIGNDADLAQQVQAGNIQIADVSIGIWSQYSPLLECVQLPFLLTSYEEELDAIKSPEMAALIAKLEKDLNVKFLAFEENGLRHFATIEKPVNTIDDIKGVKIRVAPSNVIQKAMQALGANPVTIPYAEVSTALQNRTIDAEEINITSAGAQKHYDVINYISEVGFYPYPSFTVMNGDFYKSLSADDQKLITDTYATMQQKVFDEYLPQVEEKFRKDCEDNGVKFNTVQDLTPFKTAVALLYDEYMAKDPLLKAFIEKYSAK
jgi:tripartite ATP-independent transporter DctP family solute receptor